MANKRSARDALQALSSDSDDSEHDAERDEAAPPSKKSVKDTSLNVEHLLRAGYRSGPSVMHIPEQKDAEPECSFKWSNGKLNKSAEGDSSVHERMATREAVSAGVRADAEHASRVKAFSEQQKQARAAEKEEQARKRSLSFKDKEKRKRDAGMQASAKNYVEEEKRIAREMGFYSGFDT